VRLSISLRPHLGLQMLDREIEHQPAQVTHERRIDDAVA
jgi:hypothetical protein